MNPKGSARQSPGMNAIDNGRDARSRANRRLRNLTIGTAVFGVMATGSLSALAAATYRGSTDASTAAAITEDGSTTTTTSTAAATSTGTTTPSTTAATSTTTAAPLVTTASGSGHATTGGS